MAHLVGLPRNRVEKSGFSRENEQMETTRLRVVALATADGMAAQIAPEAAIEEAVSQIIRVAATENWDLQVLIRSRGRKDFPTAEWEDALGKLDRGELDALIVRSVFAATQTPVGQALVGHRTRTWRAYELRDEGPALVAPPTFRQ